MPSTGDRIEIANLNEIKTAAESALTATGQTYTWQTEVEAGDIIDTSFLEEVVAAMDLAYDNMVIIESGDLNCSSHNSAVKTHTAYANSSFNSGFNGYQLQPTIHTHNSSGCGNWCPSFG